MDTFLPPCCIHEFLKWGLCNLDVIKRNFLSEEEKHTPDFLDLHIPFERLHLLHDFTHYLYFDVYKKLVLTPHHAEPCWQLLLHPH